MGRSWKPQAPVRAPCCQYWTPYRPLLSCIHSWAREEDEEEQDLSEVLREQGLAPTSATLWAPTPHPTGCCYLSKPPALPVLSASFIFTAQKGWLASSVACREPSS